MMSVWIWVQTILLWLYDRYWAELAALIGLLLPLTVSCHVALNKRDSRAATGWIVIAWLVPILGALLYYLFGINRIERRARQLTGNTGIDDLNWVHPQGVQPHEDNLKTLAELVGRVTGLPLTEGNQVTALEAPDAIDAMLTQIRQSQKSIYLATYIFDRDALGKTVVDALADAVQRGVEVRVLIDGVGSLYSIPTVVNLLRSQGVIVERFLYSIAPWRMTYINLRNHRKLLICDEQIAFTGGMNIRQGYTGESPSVRDIHIRLQGPAVEHCLRSFMADWFFVCKEWLPVTPPSVSACGDVLVRGISTGPDADLDKRRWTLLGALGRAQKSIRIVTPYFVPDQSLLDALELAAMRGVQVDILLPEKSNLPVVNRASRHLFPRLNRAGCRIWRTPAPFDHSKIMTVDGAWAMFGSGNWDARSLRLNFEFDVECYSRDFVASVNIVIDRRCEQARQVSSSEIRLRPLPARLLDAFAYLFEPYL